MLAQRKYDRRDASSCSLTGTAVDPARRRGAILLDAEQEIGRDQQRLQGDGECLVERLAGLLRPRHHRDIRHEFLARDRSAERSLREVRDVA